MIGRTSEAFATHPVSWQETESITNKVFSIEIGFDCDVTAGSCGLSKAAIELIAQQSQAKMTDAEWPLIIRNALGKERIGTVNVNGLCLQQINQSTEEEKVAAWEARVRLSHYIIQSIVGLAQ
ncbi:hypothetical protein SH601_14235 [Gracilibacillus sp. S3-1-1]|uniref:Uncharacterized protein n=1 Tax=Gracilibacillus pellucidus TaxID=3095368 RepID=A0ACC6M8H7_9BACI|nr:hypothetical protein [Gracilibacillus sp. S3-1-1]MDX8047147.1 hypothetical protein [Gracilibacillus sp. S3-1-1]